MINEIEEKNKRRKARRTRRRLFSFLGFLLLLIYIPALWNWVFSVNHEIGVIKTATLEIKVPLQGILVRKELVLKSPGDGILIPNVQYGEKVSKNSSIADYIKNDMRDVVESYREMEIEILKRVVTEFDSASGTERELWENAIESQIQKLSDLSNNVDLSSADSMRSSIDHVLEAKARYMLEKNTPQGSLKNEKQELERLRSSIEKSVKPVVASISGVVSFNVDGMEELYTPEKLMDIKLEDIAQTLGKEVLPEKRLTPAEIIAKKDQPFGKLVTNDEGWLVFFVAEEKGKEIAVLNEKARLNNQELAFDIELEGLEERVPAVIQEVGEARDGKQKIVARMNKYIEKTMEMRKVNGNLVIQSVTGMKVPLRSLFNENSVDHTADIVIVEMNKAKIKRVQIAGRQDSYAIIENLDPQDADKSVKVYDVYLVNPKNIVEGQLIEK